MTYIPDCRAEGPYNQENLNAENKRMIEGFDHCVETAVETFFYNTDVYFDDDSHLMHVLNERLPKTLASEEDETETYLDLFKSKLLEWIECERDQFITALIDEQGEDKGDE